jgi:hypothetical protein
MEIFKVFSLRSQEYLYLARKRPELLRKLLKTMQEIPTGYLFRDASKDTVKEVKRSLQSGGRLKKEK